MTNGKKSRRGVFAIEGEWRADLRLGLSFKPILELLDKLESSFSFVHRDAATREELFYYLNKWTQKTYKSHPILYLGFHGIRESILIGDQRNSEGRLGLRELAAVLEGRCSKRIIFFASCETMKIDGRRLNTFLKQTGALAVCGYREPVDMLKSAAFELLLFDVLLRNTLTLHGANAMCRTIKRNEKSLCRELGFRMVVRKSV